jgi:uncharacterized protein with FMN-binding domain
MARKLNKSLVALSAAAIVTIYGVGYVRTQPAADHAAATLAAQASAVARVGSPQRAGTAPSATTLARAIATATASAPSAAGTLPSGQARAAAAETAAYRDGTYNGSGTSRRGGIEVALTIQGGKVTAVEITHATTYYPTSRIARLPGQVVDRQSGQVDFVSGATDSSRAFKAAVAEALAQASSGRTGAVLPAAG